MTFDLKQFAGRLPSDSRVFGVYQPLIGWRSRLTQNRLQASQLPRFPPRTVSESDGRRLTVTLRDTRQRFRTMEDGAVDKAAFELDLFKTDPRLTFLNTPGFLDSIVVLARSQTVSSTRAGGLKSGCRSTLFARSAGAAASPAAVVRKSRRLRAQVRSSSAW